MLERIKRKINLISRSNIKRSSVENVRLINKLALIEDSKIFGNVKVGEGVWIHNCLIQGPSIEIGRNSSINGPGTDIMGFINDIKIGSFCSIARNVTIQEYDHNPKLCATYPITGHLFGKKEEHGLTSKGSVIIGNDVWIGTKSTVLSGVIIGDGAIVAANSVVTKEVPQYAVVAGNPAKVVKFRFDEMIIDKLKEIQWWDWSVEKLKRNEELFKSELTLKALENIK